MAATADVMERLQGYRQVTEAHLLALALRYGGKLVTFDRGVQTLFPGDTVSC